MHVIRSNTQFNWFFFDTLERPSSLGALHEQRRLREASASHRDSAVEGRYAKTWVRVAAGRATCLQREAVTRVERGTAIPTVVRLVELAELFGCNIDALLLESSIRADEQARAMAKSLDGLSLKDRQMLVRGLQELATRFREK